MADPFVAEIRIFTFDFAPTGWAQCDGQLLPISQNTALFSLLGTSYGGDGKSTFALPNLENSAPLHHGQGQGLTERFLGEIGGSQAETLIEPEIPLHQHGIAVAANLGTTAVASPNVSLSRSRGTNLYQTNAAANMVPMANQKIGVTGGSQPHSNMQPYLTLNFCIALQGIFPSRP